MKSLDQSVDEGIKILHKEVSTRIKSAIKNETLRMYKERKLVSVEQWKKIEPHIEKALQYMPDDFLEYPFFYVRPDDDESKKELKKWAEDYFDYLVAKKNPAYGKYQYRNCILNPDAEISSTSIRDIIIKLAVNSKFTFPCGVVNIFECPYEQGKKNYALLNLGTIWKIVHDALMLAYRLTTYDNAKTIEADFENDSAITHIDWLSIYNHRFLICM